MADRERSKPKRFKSCKIRVNMKSTRGKKVTRHLRVKSDRYSELKTRSDTAFGANSHREDLPHNSFETEHDVDGCENEMESQDGLSRYHLRRFKEYKSWETVRESLLGARIEEEAFSCETTCIECYTNLAVCRCVDCGPQQNFCMDCATTLHERRNYFHMLEAFKHGCFVPLTINNVVGLDHQKRCPRAMGRTVVCIDCYGHQHQKTILFCACESDAVTLVKLQLWPGSITRPLVAFHFKLMEFSELLLLECHVSLRKFCDVLGLNKSTMLTGWIKNMYKILNNDSFDEFRYHQHLFRTMKPIFGQLQSPDRIVCPLCPQSENSQDNDVLIESMDGCFGLVRKKSAGANLLPSRHGATMFANQDDVDKYVSEYSKGAKEAPLDCSEFKSGEVNNMLRSKGRNMLFDEKGVFGRVCRHEYPKGFISMKHGERIAYSVFEVERLLSGSGADVDVKIMYDIGCTLSAHLKKNDRQDVLARVDLAIPVFHCYGHKSPCQIAIGPRRKNGYGLTDGEGIERLWSYLRGFSSITKEMTASRRIDVLTDALFHYARHRLQQFGLFVFMLDIKQSLKAIAN